jgi:hypothetical protein
MSVLIVCLCQVIDDVAVTLGTAAAACKLVKSCGGIVAGVSCLLSIQGVAKPDEVLDCPFLALFEVPVVSRNAANEVQPAMRTSMEDIIEPNQVQLDRKANKTRDLPQPCILFADPVQQRKIDAIAAYLPHLFRTGLLTERTFPDKHMDATVEHADQLCGDGKHLVGGEHSS